MNKEEQIHCRKHNCDRSIRKSELNIPDQVLKMEEDPRIGETILPMGLMVHDEWGLHVILSDKSASFLPACPEHKDAEEELHEKMDKMYKDSKTPNLP